MQILLQSELWLVNIVQLEILQIFLNSYGMCGRVLNKYICFQGFGFYT